MPASLIPHLQNPAPESPDQLLRHFALAQLGMLQPFPRRGSGPQQLSPQPGVAAWTTTTSLSSGKQISPTLTASPPYTLNPNAPYRYFGSSWQVSGQSYPDYLFVWPNAVTGQFEQGYGFVDVETDAPQFEIGIKGTAASGRLFVDNYDGQGLRQVSNAGTWAATAAFAAGKQIRPASNNPDGHIFQVTTASTSGGAQPNWLSSAGSPGQTVTDGSVVWTNQSAEAPLGSPPPPDGNAYYLPVTFPTRRLRRIVWESSARFWGVRVARTDTIRRCAAPIGPRVLIVGDSFTEGTGGTVGWVMRFAHLRALLDTWQSGEGATGYLNNGFPAYNPRYTFRGRLQDVTAYAPDLVIIAGGINDSASSQAQVQAEAALYFQAIKNGPAGVTTGQPPILVVCGPFQSSGTPGAAAIAVRDGIRAAATIGLPNPRNPGQSIAAVVDCYIETLFGPYPYSGNTANYVNDGSDTTANPQLWWSGASGKVSAPAGLGNVDLLVSADGTHPTEAGHQHICARIDAGLEQWRQAGCPPQFVATP